MLINNPVITGSFTVNGVNVAGITGSSELSSSYLALSASYLTTSASYAQSSASLSIRTSNLEATSSTVSSSFAATSASISSRVTLIEGEYATTGSNDFTAPQQISDVSNAISFTSTASLYTDGGLRVKGSSFISGTAYFNDVVVYGTSSIEYITSSQLAIGTNIITLNTDTPSVRFGGISVFDSGSNNLSTGSLFWDSEKDKWIYSNPSASTYDGGMLISGPRNTSGLGNEVGTTSCALMMGQGGDHITSSAIFSYDNATCFYGQSYISSSGAACFGGSLTGTSATFSNTILSTLASGVVLGNSGISTSAKYGYINNTTGRFYWGVESSAGGAITVGSTAYYGQIAAQGLQISANTGDSVHLTIAPTGVTTFTCQVCVPRITVTGDSLFCSAGSTTITLEGTTPILNLTRNNNASSPAAQINFKTSQGTVRWQIATNSSTGTGLEINQGDGTNRIAYIDTSGRLSLSCYLFANGGGIAMDLNATDTKITNYGYGGGIILRRSDADSNRYGRFGIVDSGINWVGGMTINNNLSATFDSGITVTGNNAYVFQGAGATTGYIAATLSNTGGNIQYGVANSSGVYWGAGDSGAYYSTLGTLTNTALGFATNGVGRVTITSAGNVGIGITSPAGKFSIYDAVYSEYFRVACGVIGGNTTSVYLAWNNAGNIDIKQVVVGAADSGGTGYRMLRIPNT